MLHPLPGRYARKSADSFYCHSSSVVQFVWCGRLVYVWLRVCVCLFVCVFVCVCVLCLQRNLHFLIDATLSGNLHFMTSPWKARPAHV